MTTAMSRMPGSVSWTEASRQRLALGDVELEEGLDRCR